MDFQFISGVAVWCPNAHVKATVLTMADMDTGHVGVLMVSGESPDNFMVRSTASFVDKLRAEKTTLTYDNEPAMRDSWQRKLPHSVTIVQPSWSQSIVQSINVLEELREHIRVLKRPHEH